MWMALICHRTLHVDLGNFFVSFSVLYFFFVKMFPYILIMIKFNSENVKKKKKILKTKFINVDDGPSPIDARLAT